MPQLPEELWKRLESGTATAADLQCLREVLAHPNAQIVQLGKYNIQVKEGREIHIGDRTYVEINEAAIEAIVAAVQRQSAALRSGDLDAARVQRYLQSILNDQKYQQKWGFYTATDAVGQLQEPKAASMLDIGLMVQLLQPKQETQRPEQQDEAALKREKTERLPVLEGIRKYAAEHVLLMGRPGSGKTTALLKLLEDQAKQALADPSINIPVLVELRYLDADQPSVLERIEAFLQSHALAVEEATIKAALAEGRLLLLIDGVNELPSESARRAVARFRQDYPKTPMIFTTRDIAIGGDVGIEKQLEMQPLNESQMRQFVQAYLPEQGEPMLRQLQGRLREIGQTPMLLWMLCEVCRGLQQIPSSLGLLFRWFAREYDKLKQDVPVSTGLRYWQSELLQHLAFTMMQAEQPTELRVAISRQEAESVLAAFLQGKEGYPEKRAKEWLEDLLEHHLLQRTGQNGLEFHHQLLQEYYAAEYLLRILSTLSDEQLKRDYLNYLKWTEPIALMLAMVEEEAQALRVVKLAMNEVDLLLGARLAGEVKPAFQATTVGWIGALEIPLRLKCQCWATSQSEQAIGGLLKALEDQDSSIRRSAAEALGKIGSVEVIPELLKALEHQGSSIRRSAAEALGKIGSVEVIPGLLKALEHQDSSIRWSAAKALGELGSVEVIPGLLKALEDQKSSVRRSAAKALGKIGSVEVIPGLLKALEDQDSDVRQSVAKALGELSSVEAIPELLKALEVQDWDVRWRVAEALGELSSVEAIPKLLKALEHQKSFVRRSAAEALEKIGSVEAIPELLKALEHQNSFVRWSAAKALGKIGSVEVIPGLLKALEDQDWDVRRSVAEALGELGSVEAIPELLKALEHQDFSIRWSAAKALGKIGSVEAIPELLKALEHQDFSIRWSAAKALGELGSVEAIPELLKALEDQDWDVRRNVAEALGELGSVEAIPELLKALEHQDFSIRWSAAKALGKIGSVEAIPGLLKVLEHRDSSVRRSAAEALEKIGSVEATPGLLKALEHRDSSVRRSAAEALEKIGSVEAIPELLKALEHQNSFVRWSAAEALGELGSVEVIPGLLKALEDQDWDVRRSVAEALGELGSVEAIPELLKALEHWDSSVRWSAAEVLGKIGSSKLLAEFWKKQLSLPKTNIYSAISAIQNRCKYYNHEIAHNLPPQGKSIALYFSSAPSDAELQTQLANHLTLLERQQIIASWHHRQILPGDERAQVISDQLNSADIILLLISADSIADHTCYDIEINRAMERHQAGEARVIPILLRPVDWQGAPFSQLSILPKNHQPVTSWSDRDAAFQEIAEGIREVAIELRREPGYRGGQYET